MSEPVTEYKIDVNKKADPMATWVCLNCGERIGDVVRHNGIRRLQKDNGEMWEGYGVASCGSCGTTRTWRPGQEHIDRIVARGGVADYRLEA